VAPVTILEQHLEVLDEGALHRLHTPRIAAAHEQQRRIIVQCGTEVLHEAADAILGGEFNSQGRKAHRLPAPGSVMRRTFVVRIGRRLSRTATQAAHFLGEELELPLEQQDVLLLRRHGVVQGRDGLALKSDFGLQRRQHICVSHHDSRVSTKRCTLPRP